MSHLSITLFGSFRVGLDGEAIDAFKSNKVRGLLAYLAVEAQRVHRRDSLAALLWPEWPDKEARTNLRYALSNLRSAVGDREAEPPFLNISRETIQFNKDSDHWVDVGEFAQLLSADVAGAPEIDRLGEAVNLCQGEFLEGFSISDSPPFQEWVLLKREQLHRQLVETLRQLSAVYEGRGEYEHALLYARRQVELEPWQEDGHRQVMRLLAASGQPGAALAQYETCRQLLEVDLGTEPSEETQALYHQIQKGEWGTEGESLIAEQPPRPLGECPYRGLAAFREQDAAYFFGRDSYTEQLSVALREQPLVAVIVGSSGSGKSSVVYAGLLPQMRAAMDWLVVDMRPGGRPFRALAAAMIPWLEPEINETDRLVETQKLAQALSKGEVSLQDVVERVFEKQPARQHLLLFVDQFEELYTLCPDSETQRGFLDGLLTAVKARRLGNESSLVVLLTLRADFMGQALAYRPFADALQKTSVMLGPMNVDELRTAVEKPAGKQGAEFEEGLVDRILDDIGDEPGNLPLLEFALTLLWERSDSGTLSHTTYEKTGRVEGALARYADDVYSDLDESDREIAQRVFVQLVQPGVGTEDTRRVAIRAEIGEANWALTQYLADRRLVVTGLDTVGRETVEVVHEALIQRWERLRGWIEDDRTFRTWQESLRVAIHQWENTGRDDGVLLRGVPLAQAESWLDERSGELSAAERDFIQASIALRERKARELEDQRERELEAAQKLVSTERRSRRFLGALAGVLTLAVVVALLLTVFANFQRRQAQEAYSLSLAANAQQALNDLDSGTALVLALAANDINDPPQEAQRILLDTAYSPGARTRYDIGTLFPDVQGPATSLDLSPDGQTVLLGIADGSIILWDHTSGDVLQILKGHDGKVNEVALSPSGLTALSGGGDAQVIYWDLQTGRVIHRLGSESRGHSGTVRTVDISPDGRFAVSGGFQGDSYLNPGELILWDLESGREIRRFDGQLYGVVKARFSLGGDAILASSGDVEIMIATGGGQGLVLTDMLLWDVESGEIKETFDNLDHDVYDLSISPDGALALAGSYYDNIASLWDLETGERVRTLEEHQEAVRSVAFSPNRRQAATVSDDNSLMLWSLETGEPLFKLNASESDLLDLEITPDGHQAISLSRDGGILIWDLVDAAEVKRFGQHGDMIWDVAFSLDGSKVLSSSGSPSPAAKVMDASLRLWDFESGEQLHFMPLPVDVIMQVAVTPDGRQALSASTDGVVRLWDLESGGEILTLEGHDTVVSSLALSPDGKKALTGSVDGTLLYWNLESGKVIHHMYSHPDANWALAISPDGRTALSDASDLGVILWDLETGEEILRLEREEEVGDTGTSGLAYLPDGRTAVVESDGALIHYDLETGQEIRHIGRHDALRTRVEISPDGKLMLTSGMNGVLKLWDLETAELIRQFGYAEPAIIFDIAMSPDGTTALSGSSQQTIVQWRLDSTTLDELIAWIEQNRYVRELTCEERAMYQIEPLCEGD